MFRSAVSRLFSKVIRKDKIKVENVNYVPPVRKPTLQEILRQIKPQTYAILTIPLASFALGVWQIKRSFWKENLIKELELKVHRPPIPLPQTLEEISEKEYYPVHVRGSFDHSREIIMGPRTLLNSKRPASTLLSDGRNVGYFVYTPFKPVDRDYYIWVNRGWVPQAQKDPKRRQGGQVEGEIELTGLIRLTESKPQFVLPNDVNKNFWLYRNLDEMSAAAGNDVAPISIDATAATTLPDGPIGGQTMINTKNTHYNYAITWLSLSTLTGIMWWQTYFKDASRKVRFPLGR